jgi:hypothetical protein
VAQFYSIGPWLGKVSIIGIWQVNFEKASLEDHCVTQGNVKRSHANVMLFIIIFSPKKMAKNKRFCVRYTAMYCKNWDHTKDFFKKDANFSAENIAEICDHKLDPLSHFKPR